MTFNPHNYAPPRPEDLVSPKSEESTAWRVVSRLPEAVGAISGRRRSPLELTLSEPEPEHSEWLESLADQATRVYSLLLFRSVQLKLYRQLLALGLERVESGTWVGDPLSRTPASVAAASQAISEAANRLSDVGCPMDAPRTAAKEALAESKFSLWDAVRELAQFIQSHGLPILQGLVRSVRHVDSDVAWADKAGNRTTSRQLEANLSELAEELEQQLEDYLDGMELSEAAFVRNSE